MDARIQGDRYPVVRLIGFVENADCYHAAPRFVPTLRCFNGESSFWQWPNGINSVIVVIVMNTELILLDRVVDIREGLIFRHVGNAQDTPAGCFDAFIVCQYNLLRRIELANGPRMYCSFLEH